MTRSWLCVWDGSGNHPGEARSRILQSPTRSGGCTEHGHGRLRLCRPRTCEAVLFMGRGASFVGGTCRQDVREGTRRDYGDLEPSYVPSTSSP